MTLQNETNRRVLITGATGGLGIALVAMFLQAGYIVTATGRSDTNRKKIEEQGVPLLRADLTDHGTLAGLCRGQGVIVHAAALSSSWGAPQKFDEINFKATKSLLKAAREAGCTKFIYISSPSIYAAMKDQYNLTEESPVSAFPLNHYARTKLLSEKFVLKQDDKNFMTVALRPRAIVGPDDRTLFPKIHELIKSGVLPVFRGGQAIIELTDVRDVANAVLLAARKIDSVHGRAINISGGKGISVKDLAEKIAGIINLRPRFVEVPMLIAKVVALVSEGAGILRGYKKEPRLTRYTLATLAYSQTFDLSLAKKELGFIPQHDGVATILECAKRGAS